MIISYRLRIQLSIFLYLILISFFSEFSYSQIKVFERPPGSLKNDTLLFPQSSTRKTIDLNGQWEISFNEGMSYGKFSIPVAYDFNGTSFLRKQFNIPDDIVSHFSFILVAEGINYESEIKINNNFIANHTGGYTPIMVSLQDGIIGSANEINVKVNSSLNYKNTLPLSDQINYSKIYGGITGDIYLIAVPKLFVLRNTVKYTIDNLLSVKLNNKIEIRSSNLFENIDTSKSKLFFVQTSAIRKSSGENVAESGKAQFDIGDNNTVKSDNDITIANPILWTPESPELYVLKTVISDGDDKVIDEYITETGFTNLSKKNNLIFISGKELRLKGINYYEDLPKFASALEYSEVEKDLRNIKTLGFNSIRVPGRCAHPYIVNMCNRLGLFLLQEIPLNETADSYLDNDKYVRLSLNCLADIIDRDRNSPCIFAWGIGNDFDVSKNSSLSYVKSAVSLIDSLNKRFKYYTSRAFNTDICSEEVDFVGINFYGKSYEQIKTAVSDITNKSAPSSNRKNNSLFVSYYGLNIENSNSNGFSDPVSQEAQMKFIKECYDKISQTMFGNFISSYADWNSENPLNYPLDVNPYLMTNGIYTFNREQKRSTDYVKRILQNEDLPRIQEGNITPELPYAFILIGITVIVILIYFINKDKKFRSGLVRCLYKPTYFYTLVKDQMIISTWYNLLLTFSISIGMSLFFSSILYFYRENNSFDMILAKIFTNDSFKMLFSEISNNKFYLLLFFVLLNWLSILLTSFFLYFISFYTKGKSFFKNIYTICVWSSLPMLIFLFIGTILLKLSEGNPSYIKISMWLFFILYALYLNRLIIGAKCLFDIRTGKVYLYGIVIILFIFGLIYSYALFFTGVTETINLVSNLTNQ